MSQFILNVINCMILSLVCDQTRTLIMNRIRLATFFPKLLKYKSTYFITNHLSNVLATPGIGKQHLYIY